MAIIDKLLRGRVDEAGLRRIVAFVAANSSTVRSVHARAIAEGVKDPLVWLIDCNDDLGRQMAKVWLDDESPPTDQHGTQELATLARPISYTKACHRLSSSRLIDVTIPQPSNDQIDVLAVTHGGIWVVGIPITDAIRLLPMPGELLAILDEQLESPRQELLLQAVAEPIAKTGEGQLIRAIAIPWFEILRAIQCDPDFLFQFARNPRKLEEFIAASYDLAGCPHVELTPQSGDGGRDVIATWPGIGALRLLEQVKAYSPRTLVTHDQVRGMLGVLQANPNASKGIITTTSDFAPRIRTDGTLNQFMPSRLELRNGETLRMWLEQVAAEVNH